MPLRRLCALLSLAPLHAAQQQHFTVQEALSARFMNQLTAAPAKARVAWFVDQEGRRNVWVASPTEAAHPITHYTEDDGQDIDDITWSPDAESVAYTRGTGPEGSEHPTAANPAHLLRDVEQQVEVATVGGTVRILGEGHSPLFSADGKQVYFIRHGQIWFANLTTGSAKDIAQSSTPMSQKRDMGHPMGGKDLRESATATVRHPERSAAQSNDLLSFVAATTPKDTYDTKGAPHLKEKWDSDSHVTDTKGAPHLASEMWDTDSQPTTEPKQLVRAHGTASQLRLSPDGTQLAFTSHRGDHSFIGVFHLQTKTLTYSDPGTGQDHDAAWSPDSKHIAFLRESPVVNELDLRWMRSVPVPWSIRIADVGTGEGKQVWQADAGTGSLFHEIVAKNQLLWMKDNRIVFPWEKTGWLHLYALAPAARQAQLLTPGNFEIDNVVTDGRRIVYSSNQRLRDAEDVDRKHLWGYRTGARANEIYSSGEGLETNPALLSDGSLAYLQASSTTPFMPYWRKEQVTNTCETSERLKEAVACSTYTYMHVPLIKGTLQKTFPAQQFVTPTQVVFPATDNLQIHAQLFLPTGAKPTDKLPTIVFFHGGSRRQMLLGYNPMQYYAQTYELNQYFANHGYAVLSVNYRSGIGYGMEFRQAQHYGAFGGSEYLDIEGAVKWLKAQPWCDTHRIGAWGGSYGGYLTALALARDSNDFAAGVDLHGVHDWSYELDMWKPTSDPAHDTSAAAKIAFEASPMADVSKWKSPVLLMQGDDDRNVLFGQTVRLAAALRAQGVTVEEKVYPDEVHDFLLHRDWVDAYQRAADFFDRHLKAH